MLIGTSDANRVFHPYAVAVKKGGTTADFAFLYGALHSSNLDWVPSILLADDSDAISNGFVAVFGPPDVRLMCFFHVKENCEVYLKPLTKNGVCGHLKEDIEEIRTHSLQHRSSS